MSYITDGAPLLFPPGDHRGSLARAVKDVADRVGDVINAKAFGVTGNGATDDSGAIQELLTNNVGKMVFFPDGTYKLLAKISVPANVSIVGAGMLNTVFTVPYDAASAFYFGAGYGNGTINSISRCGFNTITGSPPTSGRMIETNLTEVWLSDIYIGRAFDGIYVNGTTVMTNLRLYGYRNSCVRVVGTTVCNITNFVIVGYDYYAAVPGILSVGAGILLDGTQGAGLNQNTKLLNGDILFGDIGIKIIGNAMDTATAPSFIKIDKVLSDTVGTNPLWIDYGIGITATNSWFTNGNSHGIYTDHVRDLRLIGCESMANTGYGLIFGDNSTAVRVAESSFSHNTIAGIRAAAGTSDFVVQGNRIGPAQLNGPSWSSKSQPAGVIVDAGGSDRYIIADNLVSGNSVSGVTDGGTGVNKRVANNY
jgi:hypothetical protein